MVINSDVQPYIWQPCMDIKMTCFFCLMLKQILVQEITQSKFFLPFWLLFGHFRPFLAPFGKGYSFASGSPEFLFHQYTKNDISFSLSVTLHYIIALVLDTIHVQKPCYILLSIKVTNWTYQQQTQKVQYI